MRRPSTSGVRRAAKSYEAAFITAESISPAAPEARLRVTADGRSLGSILGGSTPDESSGIWPEPVWRVEDLVGAQRCAGDAVSQHRVTFTAGTIAEREPSWRWFGPRGQLIERIALATLAMSPAALRAADPLRTPPQAWLSHPPREDPLRNLSECVQSGIFWELRQKAEREDPAAGDEVMYGGGCAFVWEHTHPGWVAAELITNAAMRAILLADRIDRSELEQRLEPWRVLVGDELAARAGQPR